MALFAESDDKIFSELLIDIVNNTNLRRASPGSKTRALAKALSGKLGQMYRKFDVNIALAFLNGAEGKYLEFIGDMMGVAKSGEKAAKVTAAEQNIRFYVDTGTFGDINGGQPILITSGTTISTSAGGGLIYTVPYNVIASATDTQLFVAAQAIKPGDSQNVGTKQLIFHNFSDYVDSANETLKVTNDAEIVTGKSSEGDTNYRFRIANQVVASEQANLTALRIAALSVPGVSDIVLIPFHRGVGSLDMLIKATTPTVADGLIAAVQNAVDGVIAMGIIATVRKPKETGFSMNVSLTLRRTLAAATESSVVQGVTNNLTDYINNLDIGEDFIVNEAIERVMATSDEIKNVGSAGKPFDSIFLYRQTKLEDNKIRSTLLGDYSPQVDEKLSVEGEFAGATPILVTVV